MSTLVVKVCEECGRQSAMTDSWLVISDLEIKSAGAGESLVRVDSEVDLCSPGCLVRYISRRLEPSMASSPSPIRPSLSCVAKREAVKVA